MMKKISGAVLATLLASGSGWVQAGGLLGGGGALGGQPQSSPAPAPQAAQGQVIAQSAAGSLTLDAASAYVEALDFCLKQSVNVEDSISDQQRQEIVQILATNFPQMDADTANLFMNYRILWNEMQRQWPQLSPDQKQTLAYEIISMAFGTEAAMEAVSQGVN